MNKQIALCTAAFAWLLGCAAEPHEGAEPERAADRAALQAPPEAQRLRDPNGVYFADVVANGTGCPAGTWATSLSEDGQTFTTTFSAYETSVNERSVISIKDCLLTVTLHSPRTARRAATAT